MPILLSLQCRLKHRHQLQFKLVDAVETVDTGFFCLVFDFAGADVPVKLRIGKGQVILVRFAAEAVNGSFLYQFVGEPPRRFSPLRPDGG